MTGNTDPHHRAAPPPQGSAHDLAVLLEPALRDACGGRLGELEWFHATWQRGGACTGFATYELGARSVGALVKIPVGEIEYEWTKDLGVCDAHDWVDGGSLARVTPRVLSCGSTLGGYDVRWIVMEKLAGPQMAKHMTAGEVQELLGAAMEFHVAAGRVREVTGRPARLHWEEAIARSREVCHNHVIVHEQRWNDLLKKVQRALPILVSNWERRVIDTWCHGDLHPGNAMRRLVGEDAGGFSVRAPLVLIDMALVHPGHWIEDALYLERQYWGYPQLLHGIKPVSHLAKMRRERGLPTGEYSLLANIRRVLAAACAPGLVEREGHPRYLEAALDVLERTLPQVPH